MSHWIDARIESFGSIAVAVNPGVDVGTTNPRTPSSVQYPAALRLFLVPQDWPAAQQARIKELRRRHDSVFRAVVEEGLGTGEFTVTGVDPVLQCMHASMSQAPAWCAHLSGRARERAIHEFADTVMMLVGVLPQAGSS
jgi:hypothetical protein